MRCAPYLCLSVLRRENRALASWIIASKALALTSVVPPRPRGNPPDERENLVRVVAARGMVHGCVAALVVGSLFSS